nr:MAG TPA: hypothetical protein [Caudoviricetes sp.]
MHHDLILIKRQLFGNINWQYPWCPITPRILPKSFKSAYCPTSPQCRCRCRRETYAMEVRVVCRKCLITS